MSRFWIGLLALGVACGGEGGDGPDGGDDPADTDEPVDTTPGALTEYPEVVPAFTPFQGEFEGLAFTSAIPDDPAGVVFLFHGTGGDGPNVVDTIEMIAILNELSARGIGFIAPTSDSRDPAAWETADGPGGNVDYQRMLRIWQNLIDGGAITETTPVFSMGFSNGGTFASYFGNAAPDDGVPVRATLIHGMTGNGGHFRDPPRMPVMWLCSVNDDKIDVDDCRSKYEEHVDNGQIGSFNPHEEGRLEPLRFMRTGYFTRQQSLDIFRLAVDNGYFSMEGERLFGADEIERKISEFTSTYDVIYPKPVNAVLKVVLAAHAINGEHAEAEAAFCADHAGG